MHLLLFESLAFCVIVIVRKLSFIFQVGFETTITYHNIVISRYFPLGLRCFTMEFTCRLMRYRNTLNQVLINVKTV